MADLYQVNFTDIACNVTTSPGKTIAQITVPSQHRVEIVEFAVSFDGVSSSAVPVSVRLARQTTAGTPNGNTTPTPVQFDPGSPAAAATLVVAGSAAWTTEPTLGDILWNQRIPPTSGVGWQYPLGRSPIVAVSSRIALVIFAAAAVNVTGHIIWEV